jgi:hypothetical protein
MRNIVLCLCRYAFSGKISRTSLIYHFGLEGLGELRLDSDLEVGEEVSRASFIVIVVITTSKTYRLRRLKIFEEEELVVFEIGG